MIWAMEIGGKPLDTPERRAHLRQSLERRAAGIADPKVRDEYRRDFDRRFEELFPARTQPQGRQGYGRGRPPGPSYTAPAMASGEGTKTRVPAQEILQKTLLAGVINHPELLDEVGEELGTAEFPAPELDRLRQAVVESASVAGLDTEGLKSHLRDQGFSGELRAVLRDDVYRHSGFVRPETPLETVRKGWKEAFGKHLLPILHAQVREAEEAVARDMTPENQRRFYDLKKRLHELEMKSREGFS
jgi:DNA primase